MISFDFSWLLHVQIRRRIQPLVDFDFMLVFFNVVHVFFPTDATEQKCATQMSNFRSI